MTSVPASAMAADQNDLNPSIGRGSRLIMVVLLYDSDALPVAVQYWLPVAIVYPPRVPLTEDRELSGNRQFKI
jgi:hypothetical protein